MDVSRRGFIGGVVAAGAGRTWAQTSCVSPFRLAVINDEISPDFDHACYVTAHDFGLSWIELRTLWGKTLASLSTDQIAEAKKILAKYKLKVTDLASPLFKVDLPGAPLSKLSEHRDTFSAEFTYKAQDELLD